MNNIAKGISSILYSIIPSGWKKIVLYSEVTETAYEVFYYCFIYNSSEPIQCYDIPNNYNILEETIDNGILKIATILKNEYKELSEKWSVLTFVLNSDGKFEIDLDYSDLSEGSYDFKKAWKEKYLKYE